MLIDEIRDVYDSWSDQDAGLPLGNTPPDHLIDYFHSALSTGPERRAAVKDKMADVLINLVWMCVDAEAETDDDGIKRALAHAAHELDQLGVKWNSGR